MRLDGWVRRASHRLRRRLGVPRISRRTALVILFVFIGLALLSATLLADFLATLGGYRVDQYEPKDFQREEYMERTMRPPTGRP
ncbi:MAG: hypothetical protein HY002_01135 [Candidatus Rokubacteria bacterium]|nr:hypothetical protein [Candidatus Rokubacteria bacterium]